MPLYEYECQACGGVREYVLQWRREIIHPLECDRCEAETRQHRLISRPAKYMGERPERVMVSGGNYDTTGHRTLPDMPMPESEPGEINGEAYTIYPEEACKQHFESQEWKAWQSESKAIIAEDKLRQERTAAIKRGDNIDLRSNPLPGDPQLD